MDEIEDEYKLSIEKIEEEFFEQFKKGMPMSEIEKIYLLKLKKAREQYEKSLARYLGSIRKNISSGKKYTPPKETSPFEVEPLDLSDTKFQRFKFKFKMNFFRMSRAFKNFSSYMTPKKLLYLKFVIKINVRRVIQFIQDSILSFVSFIQEKALDFFTLIGKFFVSLSQKVKSFLTKLKSLFGKKIEKKEEKKIIEPGSKVEPNTASEEKEVVSSDDLKNVPETSNSVKTPEEDSVEDKKEPSLDNASKELSSGDKSVNPV